MPISQMFYTYKEKNHIFLKFNYIREIGSIVPADKHDSKT